jgi:CPA2 family monovalent cation:H+ antiporter-2
VASSINIAAYSDALIVLGTAGLVVPLVHRWGLNPILGYLGAGALLGPLGLGTFVDRVPLLYWFTVVDAKNVAGIADLGVVFLLFLIGLELSYERLLAMRRLVLGLGGLQVAVTTAVLTSVLMWAGLKGAIAVLLAACLALSSTAIVLDLLSRQGRMATRLGRASFAVLLAQDLAVIPILMFISVLGAGPGASLTETIGTAFLQAIAALTFIVVIGRLVLRPLFRSVAHTNSSELFIAAILFVIVATGVVAAAANLSMALGAFVAGLLLAETEYRKAIEATIEPFKGLLLGIFFFTVGMAIDVRELLRDPFLLIAAVVALVAVKSLIVLMLAQTFGMERQKAIELALLLGPAGEFAFVGIGLASSLGALERPTAAFVLAVASISMALTPLLAAVGQRLSKWQEAQQDANPVLALVPESRSQHAIVVGYGRFGQVVCTMLSRHGISYTAVDPDPASVSRERALGNPVYFGDPTNPAFLRACGIDDAIALIVTVSNRSVLDRVVMEARLLRPDVALVARARDSEHAQHLYELGVTDAIPETVEASLQLSEAALVGLGVPTGPVIASIHELRDEFRRDLQAAAERAGLSATRSIKSKAKPAA